MPDPNLKNIDPADLMRDFILKGQAEVLDLLEQSCAGTGPIPKAQARHLRAVFARMDAKPKEDWRDDFFLGHDLGYRTPLASLKVPSMDATEPTINWADITLGVLHGTRPLCLIGEQGIGDQLRWSHYFNKLSGRSGLIYALVTPKLLPLLEANFPEIRFLSSETAIPSEAIRLAMGDCDSLFWHAKESPQASDFLNTPLDTGFLTPNSEKERLLSIKSEINNQRDKRPLVGVCYRSMHSNPFRSLHYSRLDDWAWINDVQDVQFVNLQYGLTTEEKELLEDEFGDSFLSLPALDTLDDIAGMAVVIKELDLVMGVSTMALDLSAALGIPSWRLMPNYHLMADQIQPHPWYGASTQHIGFDLPADWPQIMNELQQKLNHHLSTNHQRMVR